MTSTLSPVQLIFSKRHADSRGWFTESYNQRVFAERGINSTFVQDNHSLSRSAFTLRGLHFQTPPYAQDKLVRCIRGSIYDVAVDIRAASPTYGRWVAARLSADNGLQLFVPVGFAHGFLTLEPDCEVLYKCSTHYSATHDAGVRWDDPTLGIAWPIPVDEKPVVSDKDSAQPGVAQLGATFTYDGRPLLPLE